MSTKSRAPELASGALTYMGDAGRRRRALHPGASGSIPESSTPHSTGASRA